MDKSQENFITSVIENTDDMTIATIREDGFPQATTVSFVNDGMTLFFGTSAESQKAKNIDRNEKVSLTIDHPYKEWEDIRSLSMGGLARRVTDPDELERIGALLMRKFPKAVDYEPDSAFELAFYRVDPKIISIIDYSRNFGHTEEINL